MAEVIDVSLGFKDPCSRCVWDSTDVCLVCKYDDYPLSKNHDCFEALPKLKPFADIIPFKEK